MGRIKEQLLEEDWVEDEQQRIIAKRHSDISITYADLFDEEDISNSIVMYINTIDNVVHVCESKDIIELHGLHIKYKEDDNIVTVIPLDKIVSVKYVGQ